MNTAELLTEASALWATSRKGYRDGLIGVGRLLQSYLLARLAAGDGLNEAARRKAGASRERATADAAAALGAGRLKVAELIRVAAVADLLTPIGGFGPLSYSCLRSMRAFVHRPGRGKKVSRVKAGSDGHLSASALEVWAVRPGFAKRAPDIVARAVAGAWRDSDLRRELARKGGPSTPQPAAEPCRPTAPKNGVFTTGQVAKMCEVAPRTVSKWFDSGRLKGYRIPGSLDRRVPRIDLFKFLTHFGMPIPSELAPPAGARLALWVADPPGGFTAVDQFEFGATVASGPVEVALIGDECGASVAVRAARFLRARHAGARIVLVLSDDAGAIDPAGMAGVEISRGSVDWFGLGIGAELQPVGGVV